MTYSFIYNWVPERLIIRFWCSFIFCLCCLILYTKPPSRSIFIILSKIIIPLIIISIHLSNITLWLLQTYRTTYSCIKDLIWISHNLYLSLCLLFLKLFFYFSFQIFWNNFINIINSISSSFFFLNNCTNCISIKPILNNRNCEAYQAHEFFPVNATVQVWVDLKCKKQAKHYYGPNKVFGLRSKESGNVFIVWVSDKVSDVINSII